MRVTVVSTYPPRLCGIAEFTRDLRDALRGTDSCTAVDIVSITRDEFVPYATEVVATISQDDHGDYLAAARTISVGSTDVVLLQHEYGIFGGDAGSFAVSLADHLRQPLVITLHTVLSEPSVAQAETLRDLCRRATLVTVFTETARRLVLEAQLVPPERVRVVPHGAPIELRAGRRLPAPGAGRSGREPHATFRSTEGRTVLSTFGLISEHKGIEVAVRALPAIVARHPDVLYLVAGQTHPEVVRSDGERHRLALERLVRDLGLTDHVRFLDRFLSVDDLAVLLASTDVYLTPYRSRQQIVSGALTFAVVAGCPTVSTPYFYAEDMLGSGAGVLVPFDDPQALADGVLSLLDDPAALAAARAEASRVGESMTWPAVGEQISGVLSEAVQLGPVRNRADLVPTVSSPRVRPDHLLSLVDDVGILQHADGVVPVRAAGYCVDDVARLVVVALRLQRNSGGHRYARMAALGVSFLRHAYDPSASGMHNFMAYDRRWQDEPHGGDHLGRTVWALGEAAAARPATALATTGLRLLEDIAPILEAERSLRPVAFGLLGLSRPPPGMLTGSTQKLLEVLAARLVGSYLHTRGDDWRWFSDELTYDNGRLPQALIAAGHRLSDPAMTELGLEALDWYSGQCQLDSPVVRLVGNRWRRRHAVLSRDEEGDEQPLDAAALVEAHTEALAATGRPEFGRRAVRAFEWFLGRNRLGVPVYDFATGGCHDGLGTRLNENQGAESTLAFFQALLALDAAGLQASLPRR